jgi:hypothetical protein
MECAQMVKASVGPPRTLIFEAECRSSRRLARGCQTSHSRLYDQVPTDYGTGLGDAFRKKALIPSSMA